MKIFLIFLLSQSVPVRLHVQETWCRQECHSLILVNGSNQWTIRGDVRLDPGNYEAILDKDKFRIATRDYKGKTHTQTFRLESKTWLRPIL